MAQFFTIYPQNPQSRLIRQAVAILRDGGVIVYPTDTCYALGCQLGDKGAMERIRTIRQLDERHHFTLSCSDLSQIAQYARVDNRQYRLLKAITPGSYTFILEATREVPRRLQHPKRSTIGIRLPDHPVAAALLGELGEPLLTTTLLLPGQSHPLSEPEDIRDQLEKRVDLVIDAGACGMEVTTVIDLTEDPPVLVRSGKGDVERLRFSE